MAQALPRLRDLCACLVLSACAVSGEFGSAASASDPGAFATASGAYLQQERGARLSLRTSCAHRAPIAYSEDADAFALFLTCRASPNPLSARMFAYFYPEQRLVVERETICPRPVWGPDLAPVDRAADPKRLDLHAISGGRFVYFCPEHLERFGERNGLVGRFWSAPYVIVDARDPNAITQELRYLTQRFERQAFDYSIQAVSESGLAALTWRTRELNNSSGSIASGHLIVDLNSTHTLSELQYWSELAWCAPEGGDIAPSGHDCSVIPGGFVEGTDLLWATGRFWPSMTGRRRGHGMGHRAEADAYRAADRFDAIVDLGEQGWPLRARWAGTKRPQPDRFQEARSPWIVSRNTGERVTHVRNMETGEDRHLIEIEGSTPRGVLNLYQVVLDRDARRLLAARQDDRLLLFDLETARSRLDQSQPDDYVPIPDGAAIGVDKRNRLYAFHGVGQITYLATVN